ncbi:hypothetical protein [uncultured Shewanella sp.]|uniref:hypothetical protein n=1 Tax=uncultured Shewanella sp. TaxID=173975 RepID=UPI002616155E|nr:hypothetical protein [uncultured Shewanella sp.]
MSKISVKQEDSFSIKFIHQLKVGETRHLGLYFFFPKEMGISTKSIDEEEYYHSGITGRRSYHSPGIHLPLVQSRFISQKKRTIEEFRLYLNLFAYQFAVATETDCKELRQIEVASEFYPALNELSNQVFQLLKRFRRNEPSDPKWKSYFENADNYLSWLCEQELLKLLAYSPRDSAYSESYDAIVQFCRKENEYRQQRQYNSAQTIKDPNRIANKMLLLRRLIQQGVVLKEEKKLLGVGLKKMTTGIATSLVMIVVSSLIIKAQGVFSGLTTSLVLALAVIYGFREIFKEDMRNVLWKFIRKGRPRWSRTLLDTTSKLLVAKQLVWLDFIRKSDLPVAVADILKQRNKQNKVDSEILHYGVYTKVTNKDFLAGYSTIQEQINFSLSPFARYLERGKAKIYTESDGKVSHASVERRYQVNVVVVSRMNKQDMRYARYKITMNRSSIIEISESELPSQFTHLNDLSSEEKSLMDRAV